MTRVVAPLFCRLVCVKEAIPDKEAGAMDRAEAQPATRDLAIDQHLLEQHRR